MTNTNTLNKRYNKPVVLLLLFFFFASAQVSLATAADPPKPVVEVNGKILTEMDLNEALNELMPAGRFHGGFSSEKRNSYRPEAIENMVEKELLYQEAVSRGLNVEDKLIEQELEKAIKRFGSKKQLEVAVKNAGMTFEEYKTNLKKKHFVSQLLTLEVTDKAVTSDQEVKTYYETNRTKFKRPEARRIRHILIKVPPTATAEERKLKREKAEEAINKVKAGEDMALIASQYSNGPYRVKGGDLGLVHKGRLYPEVEKEAFQLELGQLSDIVKTMYGYHFVRVEEIRAPEQLELKDVENKVKKELTEKKEKQLKEALMTMLKAKAQIKKY
jgi:parvulin-like peptidyl-prolyl isomerase